MRVLLVDDDYRRGRDRVGGYTRVGDSRKLEHKGVVRCITCGQVALVRHGIIKNAGLLARKIGYGGYYRIGAGGSDDRW